MQIAIFVAPCPLGRGVFAGREFEAGELMFCFAGPIITLAEAIAKGCDEGNAMQIGPETYLDLEPPSVFANHSCAPNMGIRHGVEARALVDIPRGTEIRFDYSTTMCEGRWTMQCACGSSFCRGSIGDFHGLPPTLRQHYLQLGIVQPFIAHHYRCY